MFTIISKSNKIPQNMTLLSLNQKDYLGNHYFVRISINTLNLPLAIYLCKLLEFLSVQQSSERPKHHNNLTGLCFGIKRLILILMKKLILAFELPREQSASKQTYLLLFKVDSVTLMIEFEKIQKLCNFLTSENVWRNMSRYLSKIRN